jgi:hypothetical protein
METGKVKNPWPNVDAHSGVLLQVSQLVSSSLNVFGDVMYLIYFGFQLSSVESSFKMSSKITNVTYKTH